VNTLCQVRHRILQKILVKIRKAVANADITNTENVFYVTPGKYQIGKLWVSWHLEVQTIQELDKCLKESDFQRSKSEKTKKRKPRYE